MDALGDSVGAWAAQEIDTGAFQDKRLGSRLTTLLCQLGGAIGRFLPMACQDWASTKSAYRFLSSSTVGESEILVWRIFWLTMMNRAAPQAPPGLVFTVTEVKTLDHIQPDKTLCSTPNLTHYMTKVARLGGYLARAHDPPPGNIVMWRGW